MTRWRKPLEPYGRALMDYYRNPDPDLDLTLHSTLGEHDRIPVETFFRGGDGLFSFERLALALCRGRVLDVGAGAGADSLILQDRGLEVTALEVVPEAAEILLERGVRRVVAQDVFDFREGGFDTLLMMMNGVGPAGTLEGLDRLLTRARLLLAPGGQILLDSAEPARSDDPVDPALDGLDLPPEPTGDGYPGEAWIQLEYEGEVAPPFRELYLGEEALAERARRSGWSCSFLHRDEHGCYLAQLLPEPEA